jgi:hypothetical protein
MTVTALSAAQIAAQIQSARESGAAIPAELFAGEVRVRHMTGECLEHRAPGEMIAAGLALEAETFRRAMPDFEYADARCIVGDDAIVMTHALKGTPEKAPPIFVPMCAVFEIEDGKIVAIDAYMDSARESTYVELLRAEGFPA